MLTKNFYSYIRATLQKQYATFTKPDGTTESSDATANYPPFKVMNSWRSSNGTTGVSFGTGTTPPTVSDYEIESILDSSKISVAAPGAVSFSRTDTYDEYSVTFGITNKTAAAITISEVGLTAMPVSGTYALVDRTVLDAPVTIPAGQSKQITYTIRFNYGV